MRHPNPTALSRLLMLACLALSFSALSGTSAHAAPAFAEAPILLGAHIPLTGESSELGQGFRYGVELALKEINAHGGVNGHELKLSLVDDRSTPDGAVTAVERLTLRDKVLVLWNGSSSSPTVAVLPGLRDGPVPYYVSFASDRRVLEPFSDFVFSGAAMPMQTVAANIIDVVSGTLKAKTVALMSCDQANCRASMPILRKGFEARGVKVVTEQTFHSGDTDFTGQITAIKSLNPDVVQVWGLPADGGRIVSQLRRSGVTSKIVGDTGLADQSVLDLAGPAAEGMYAMWIGGAQFLTDTTGAMGDWRKRFAAAYPSNPTGMPNAYSVRAYADAYVIAEALRRAGSDLSQKNIVAKLDTIQDFVAGRDAYFSYAAPIGLPRSFTATDHQGTKTLAPVIVSGGIFAPVQR